jgi:ubiquinone/menaquinone biosynthesis C-methylase UbiE
MATLKAGKTRMINSSDIEIANAQGDTRGSQVCGNNALNEVIDYWNTHLNSTQFLDDENYSEGSPEFFARIETAFQRFPYKKELFDWIADLPGRKLLEIGCGLGNDLCQLARRGLDVTGIDIAPRAVHLARQHLASHGLSGDVSFGNCECLDYADDSFDIVYSSGVIQHTPDIEASIDEILRVLRPSGTLIIILYHRHSWFRLLSKLTGTNIEFADAEAPIIRTFSRSELRRLFGNAADVRITMEHYRPSPTVRRGVLSALFNRVFVPCYGSMPARLIRPFGWHAVVTGKKLST